MDTNIIKFAPLFTGFDDEELALLAENFTTNQYSNGETLFKAGDQSDALFLIGQGFARLATATGQNLATLGPGSVLGEAYLLRCVPYDVTATAVAAIEGWRLSDQKLRSLIMTKPSIGLKLSQNFGSLPAQMEDYLVAQLAKTQELSSLPRHTLQALASRLQSHEVAAGQQLLRAGDAASGLYLLESGVLEMRAEAGAGAGSAGEPSQTIRPGSLLGAQALLTNKPNVYDVVAIEESRLWSMSGTDFQEVNKLHPGLRRSLSQSVRVRLSKEDQGKAAMRMSQMPLFAELPADAMRAITQRMLLRHVSAGERVYRIGEAGDALYLVESGEIELTAENANGVIEELARVQSDGFFGEMSILTGQIRTEDATATRNTNLWLISKSDLDALATQHPAVSRALSQGLAMRLASEQAESEDRYRRFALFADLPSSDLQQVVRYLNPTRYRAGELIFRASSPSQTLFLIDQGEVRVQTFNGGSWMLGPGESFGERALLTNQPHSANVTAETDVDLWTLSKTDFDILLSQYPSLAISLSRLLSQRLGESNAYITPQDGSYRPLDAATPIYAPAATTRATSLNTRGEEMGYYEQMDLARSPQMGVAERRQRQLWSENIETTPRRRMSFGRWYSSLSGFAKLRLVLILLLLIWLIGVALPLAMLQLARGSNFAGSAPFPMVASRSLAAVYSLGSYEVARADQQVALEIAMVDRQAQPSPTYTPFPTNTPIPTSTPLPTNTPLPTATLAPTPQQIAYVAPQVAEAAPEPEVQAAAIAPRAWDPRLDQLGVKLDEANVAPGEKYMRLVEAIWWDERESAGKHHIYVDVLDESGNRMVGQPVKVYWGDGEHIGPVEDKPFPEYGFNYDMYAAGYAYSARVEGFPSDVVSGAGMGDLERRFYGIHTSYLYTFRLTTK